MDALIDAAQYALDNWPSCDGQCPPICAHDQAYIALRQALKQVR